MEAVSGRALIFIRTNLPARGRKLAVALIAAIAVLLVGVLIVQTVSSQQRDAEQAAFAAAERKAEEEAERAREKEAVEKTAADLGRQLETANRMLPLAESRYEESAGWASEADRATLLTRIEQLQDVLETDEPGVVKSRVASLQFAYDLVGTKEQYQARKLQEEQEAAAKAAAEAEKAAAEAAAAAEKAAAEAAAEVDRAFEEAATAAGFTRYSNTALSARELCKTWLTDLAAGTNVLTLAARDVRDPELPFYTLASVTYCPDYMPVLDRAKSGIPGGSYLVGRDMAAGTWVTAPGIRNCYWERNDGGGNIRDNNFVMGAPNGVSVRLSAGEGFLSDGCGPWFPG